MKPTGLGRVGPKLMNRFFRPVDGAVWDLLSGKMGIRTESGILTLEGEADDAEVAINVFDDFGIEMPAFAQQTAASKINNGDLIYGDGGPLGWIIGQSEDGKDFTVLRPGGDRISWRPPKAKGLGLDMGGIMVLRSLADMLPSGGLGDMQNALLPMMLLGGDEFDTGDLSGVLPLMLMNQTGVVGKTGGVGGMLQTLLMMRFMKKKPTKKSPRVDGGGSFFD